MESVIFDGKEFVKASVLAKRFKYTPDYLGQLCRGKKVDARLVGRSWYINLDSLNEHKGSRYKTETKKLDTPQVIAPTKAPEPRYLTRIDVEPILKGKTVRLLKETKNGLRDVPVKYEHDDNALIPKVAHSSVKKNIAIDMAGSEMVKINKETVRPSFFKPEPIPEVYLKGRLSVEGLPENIEIEPTPNEENVVKPSHIGINSDIPVKKHSPFEEKPLMQKVTVRRTLKTTVSPSRPIPVMQARPTSKAPNLPLHDLKPVKSFDTTKNSFKKANFTPISVKNSVAIRKEEKKSSSYFLKIIFSTGLLVAGLFFIGTAFLRSDISVKNGMVEETYQVDFKVEFFSKIFSNFL